MNTVSDQVHGHMQGQVKGQVKGQGNRLTVMVVDDSKTIRRNAESLLSREGFSVVTAIDGFDAIAKVVDYHPDIVFVDITMPRLDGYQTCALIKNNETYRDIPVIMLSSRDSIFDKAKGRIVGAGYYLTKPFTRDDILGAIRRHVPSAGSAKAAPGGSSPGLHPSQPHNVHPV